MPSSFPTSPSSSFFVHSVPAATPARQQQLQRSLRSRLRQRCRRSTFSGTYCSGKTTSFDLFDLLHTSSFDLLPFRASGCGVTATASFFDLLPYEHMSWICEGIG
nr:hypothetical protein Iba_chr07eCG10950 [Ipomoea batatas]GMD81364.1 hypothetical protein Iba_chr13eCG10910 [Ipomoea batatas]